MNELGKIVLIYWLSLNIIPTNYGSVSGPGGFVQNWPPGSGSVKKIRIRIQVL